jgi:cellulase/cellobiase CelA1
VDPQSSVTVNPAGGQSVSLNFDVVNQGLVGYTAHLDVVNSSGETLPSATVSLPIHGRVLDVTGGGWTQDGDLLIIDLPESLDTGGSTQLTISATGRGAAPANCGMVGGECAVK